ncbi:MAG: acyltransferase [Calothrix sp. MO_167.B12]|nr:acyltransferase [Calothrix sp. MO_167.B12]
MNTIIAKEVDAAITKGSSNKLDALLTLRGFACLMVVVYHGITLPQLFASQLSSDAQLSTLRQSIIYKGYDLTWILFSHGPVAVWVFFVLSGYLMGKAFYSGRYIANVSGTINFWRNRILRIFPLYYFVALILIILVYTDYLKLSNWGYLLRVLTFTYNPYIGGQALQFNIPFWSLSTEVQFYIVIPVIYCFFSSRLKNIWSIATTAVIVIAGTLLIKSAIWIGFHNQMTEDIGLLNMNIVRYWYVPLINNLDLFLCGFLVNPLLKYYENSSINLSAFKLPIIRILAIILLIGLYLFCAHHAYYQEKWLVPTSPNGFVLTPITIFLMQPLTALITAFFIFTFEASNYHISIKNEKLSFNAILENPIRILEIFGILSYGIYLWHFPIMQKISLFFSNRMPLESSFLVIIESLILAITLAAITYYLVEQPFTKQKKFNG